MTTPESDPALELRLRRDAPAWGGKPSATASVALRARLATLPPSRAPRWPLVVTGLVAAAALATIAVLWRGPAATPAPVPQAPVPQAPAPFVPAPTERPLAVDVSALEARALAPLRAELLGLAQDGRLLALGMWQQVPEPVRRLLE